MADDIPEWAAIRAAELSNARYGSAWTAEDVRIEAPRMAGHSALAAFASYIADVSERLQDAFSGNATAIGRDYWRDKFADLCEPPVDPLLVEARKIAAERWLDENMDTWGDHVLAGACDNHIDVKQALRALKRGIELAKAGEQ